MPGAKKNGELACAAAWRILREQGPMRIGALAKAMGVGTKVAYKRVAHLRARGLAQWSGPVMHTFYEALGDEPPTDLRPIEGMKYLPMGWQRLRHLAICEGESDVIQCRREGTPGEIARIPSLAELLAR
jgi:hypothetical protein